MSDEPGIAEAIAVAARSINQRARLNEALDTLVEVARDSVPGFDHVGISTIDNRGNVETRAGTGELVWDLDKVQYGLGEGPCVDSLRDANVVSAPRIRHNQRWPRYVPAAVEAGLRAQLAVKLYLDDKGTVGGINLYSTASEDIDPTPSRSPNFSLPMPRSPWATPRTGRTSTRPCTPAR
jgi:hypothetical protein